MFSSKKRIKPSRSKNHPRKYNFTFYREIFMGVLAIVSVASLAFELMFNISEQTIEIIFAMDLLIALVFLSEYLWMLYRAGHKGKFIIKNWYLLLASIPIVDSWAEVFRSLRLFRVFRVFRAGEHIEFSWHELMRDNSDLIKKKGRR